jgi:hypothetical protein
VICAAQQVVGQIRERSLDLVDLAGVGGGVVDLVAGMLFKPAADRGALVRGVVVTDRPRVGAPPAPAVRRAPTVCPLLRLPHRPRRMSWSSPGQARRAMRLDAIESRRAQVSSRQEPSCSESDAPDC